MIDRFHVLMIRHRRLQYRILVVLALATMGLSGVLLSESGQASLGHNVYLPITYRSDPPPNPCLRQTLANPGFEDQLAPYWTELNGVPSRNSTVAQSGGYSLQLGGSDLANAGVSQATAVPTWAETAALDLSWRMVSNEVPLPDLDQLQIAVYDAAENRVGYSLVDNTFPTGSWRGLHLSLGNVTAYRGQNMRVAIWGTNDVSWPTTWYVDDVQLIWQCGGASPSATPTDSPSPPTPTPTSTPGPTGGLQRFADPQTPTNPSYIQTKANPQWYIPRLHQLTCDENHGMLRALILVLDPNGNPLNGVHVVVNTMDGAWPTTLTSGDKGPGLAEYAFLTSNHTGGRWKAEIEGGHSDIAMDLATDLDDEPIGPSCPNGGNTRNHYSYDVTFRKVQ